MVQKRRLINRRGDIPITILVLGVVSICALAILSFFISDRVVQNGLEDTKAVERAVVDYERMLVYKELGFSEGDIIRAFGVKTGPQGRYIEVESGDVRVQYFLP